MDLEENQKILREKVESILKTKQDLAQEMDIDYVHFTRWLSGKDVGLATLVKINRYLQAIK